MNAARRARAFAFETDVSKEIGLSKSMLRHKSRK
jgi:hypothetical protein